MLCNEMKPTAQNQMAGKRRRIHNYPPNRKLALLRINKGLTPNRLAAIVNTSGAIIRAAEDGITPREDIQARIAAHFDLNATDIFPLDSQRAARIRR